MKIQNFLFFIFLMLGVWSCTSDSVESTYVPNVEQTAKVNLTVIRFEEILNKIDSSNIALTLEELKSKYPEFTKLFVNYIIYAAPNASELENLQTFVNIEPVKPLLDTVLKAYPKLDDIQGEVENMLRFRNYYFPNLPKIDTLFSYISLYNYGAGFYENYAILGLDYFLGEGHGAYMAIEQIAPLYIRRTLNKAHITRSLAFAQANLIVDEMAKRAGNKMIDFMLFEGKKLYLTKAFMPTTADTIVYAFTTDQYAHCLNGERSLYDYLLKEKLFYSDKYRDFQKYVEIGPFNPNNALYGNSGAWLGAQMISQYVEHQRKNSNKSDSEIMEMMLAENNPQTFFKLYKPKR